MILIYIFLPDMIIHILVPFTCWMNETVYGGGDLGNGERMLDICMYVCMYVFEYLYGRDSLITDPEHKQ